jgi:hypothetical protein
MFASESSVPGSTPAEGARQGGDVTGTLAELERKLRELERELTSIGRRREGEETAQTPGQAPPPSTAGEAGLAPTSTEYPMASPTSPPASNEPSQPPVAHEAYAVAHESPSPSSSSGEASFAQPAGGSQGRLVDEAIESEPERARPSDAQLESLAELRRFRDRLERFGRELATEYDALLGRVMSGLFSTSGSEAQAPQPTPPTGPPPPVVPEVSEAEARESTLFEGRVELGVGPFYDIAALGAFEQRLASLPGVSEATVRRFEASHAVVDVRLAAPVALVRELRLALDSDFGVREVASGRILLTFDDA